MGSPKEIKNWIKYLIQRCSKKNGVIPSGLLDCPEMEIKLVNSKNQNKRYNKKQILDMQ